MSYNTCQHTHMIMAISGAARLSWTWNNEMIYIKRRSLPQIHHARSHVKVNGANRIFPNHIDQTGVIVVKCTGVARGVPPMARP